MSESMAREDGDQGSCVVVKRELLSHLVTLSSRKFEGTTMACVGEQRRERERE